MSIKPSNEKQLLDGYNNKSNRVDLSKEQTPINWRARIFAQSTGDEICITGLAGAFPSSRNVAEFEHNLWNKVYTKTTGYLFNISIV